MRSAPEQDPHGRRLRSLARHYRHQERWMEKALRDAQGRLERQLRDTTVQRLETGRAEAETITEGDGLQQWCDELATELVHVRMAIAGADEEIATHETHTWIAPVRHRRGA